ncbi:vomeronasal type-1 receptor 3-like [Ambystoma mexicanum]|uniref:vomeronasal type-1 receptor 3-like n=1 Tax=Ambystoma mexicanum TaxID=8296 RepID=UPI0037E7A362
MALLANLLLLLCFHRESGLSTNDWILVHLSVVNILSAVTRNGFACMAIFGVMQGLCQVDIYFLAMALYLTAYCNCFLSLNQSIQVLKFRYIWMMRLTLWLKRHLALILITVWGFSMLAALPIAITHTLNVNTTAGKRKSVLGKCILTMGLGYKVAHAFLSDVIPLVIYLFSTLVLVWKLWKHKRQVQAAGLPSVGWRNAKEKRATQTVLMLLLFYVTVEGCNHALSFVRESQSVWEPKVITKTTYAIISVLIIIQGNSKMQAKISKALHMCSSYPAT